MRILVTGGAGFIGSNLVDHFLEFGHQVVCLDNLATGFEKNIEHNYGNPNFTFINGDIRDVDTCRLATADCQLVSHQAALGSVPRSIADPINTNTVNIDGFLNILVAARDAKVKRFVYASSSSVYGDSKKLPKVEEDIGKPLSPYAVTKQVNEIYADVFAKNYGMQCIGLRYFNVFGKRQDPNGPYAAVIPLWVKKLLNHEQPVINGDGNYSRDFTYIDNVLHANEVALFTENKQIFRGQREYYNLELDEHKYLLQIEKSKGREQKSELREQKSEVREEKTDEDLTSDLRYLTSNNSYFSEVFNIAYGGNTTLNQLFTALRDNLAKFDKKIADIEPEYGPFRVGDIPHSQASILKAKTILGYDPKHNAKSGFELAAEWYFNNL